MSSHPTLELQNKIHQTEVQSTLTRFVAVLKSLVLPPLSLPKTGDKMHFLDTLDSIHLIEFYDIASYFSVLDAILVTIAVPFMIGCVVLIQRGQFRCDTNSDLLVG